MATSSRALLGAPLSYHARLNHCGGRGKSSILAAPKRIKTTVRSFCTTAPLAKPQDSSTRAAVGRRKTLLAGLLVAGGAGGISFSSPVLADELQSAGASGILFTDEKVGKGPEVFEGDVVKVNYTGRFMEGGFFDSARFFVFGVGNGEVIKGWDLSLGGDGDMPPMKVGGVRNVVIPSNLAYGSRGAGGVIPPNATLQFQIELVSLK